MTENNKFAADYSLINTKTVKARGLKLAEPLRFAKKYGLEKTYEPLSLELWELLIRDGDVVCDVGAHHGIYSLLAAQTGRAKDIYAYEPVKENLDFLRNNARLNNLSVKITARNIALSDKVGEVDFQITEASDNANIKGHPNSPTLRIAKIKTSTLDVDFKNSKLDLIKIDTDGYEPYILDGATSILKNNPQLRMLIEFNPKCLRRNRYEPQKFLKRLVEFGFELYLINDSENTISLITDNKTIWSKIESTAYFFNILCLPATAPGLQSFIEARSQTEMRLRELEQILKEVNRQKEKAETRLQRIHSTKTWRYLIKPARKILPRK